MLVEDIRPGRAFLVMLVLLGPARLSHHVRQTVCQEARASSVEQPEDPGSVLAEAVSLASVGMLANLQ